jgi:hypothetical protein
MNIAPPKAKQFVCNFFIYFLIKVVSLYIFAHNVGIYNLLNKLYLHHNLKDSILYI